MSTSLQELLGDANAHINRILAKPDLAQDTDTPRVIAEIGPLLARVGSQLDDPLRRGGDGIELLLTAYSTNLVGLRTRLDELESALRQRREALGAERKRMNAVRSWTATYRSTI